MILRRDEPQSQPAGAAGSPPRIEGPDEEVARAKMALLRSGQRFRGPKRPWPKRHPVVLGVGLFAAGVLIGRSPMLRGLVAAAAVLAARTAAQRLTGRLVGRLRF